MPLVLESSDVVTVARVGDTGDAPWLLPAWSARATWLRAREWLSRSISRPRRPGSQDSSHRLCGLWLARLAQGSRNAIHLFPTSALCSSLVKFVAKTRVADAPLRAQARKSAASAALGNRVVHRLCIGPATVVLDGCEHLRIVLRIQPKASM